MNLPQTACASTITVGKKQYTCRDWVPGMDLPSREEPFVALDTETEPIIPGTVPPLVLLQVCYPRAQAVDLVPYTYADEYLQMMYNADFPEWVFHHAAFDLHVLDYRNNWLLDYVNSGRITCCGLRFLLDGMAKGTYTGLWNLEFVAQTLLGITMDKEDELRMSFRRGVPLSERQKNYALADPAATAQIREILDTSPGTEWIQLVGSLALYEIALNGMLVDFPYMDALRGRLESERTEYLDLLNDYGWRPEEDGNSRRVQEFMQKYEREYHLRFRRTPKSGDISTKKADMLRAFGFQLDDDEADGTEDFDPMVCLPAFLKAFLKQEHLGKILSTYLNRDLIQADGRVHPSFTYLVKTGRASCKKPNLMNLPRAEGIRGIYVAPEGYCLAAIDYSQLELCALAQHCYTNFGFSVMRDVINQGEDLHYWFGDLLIQRWGKSTLEEIRKEYRQRAKVCNFGYPGGLGARTFQTYARGYGVEVSLEEAKELKALWLEAFPEMKLHLKPSWDPVGTARKIRNYCREHGYPSWISTPGDLEHAMTEKGKDPQDVRDALFGLNMYLAHTVTGRLKRDCPYCAACNLPFQGLAADGAKLALWYILGFGYRIVDFIHDEVLIELPLDDQLTPRVKHIQQVMEWAMNQVIPDVAISTKPAIMLRWHKNAEPVYDEAGNLQLWIPKAA